MQGGGEWQAKIKSAGGGLYRPSPHLTKGIRNETMGYKQAYLTSFLTEMGERGQRVALS